MKDVMTQSVTKNYKAEYFSCHIPARSLAPSVAADADKWIYMLGYSSFQRPLLRCMSVCITAVDGNVGIYQGYNLYGAL